MQCIVTYAAGIYWQPSKISSEIQILILDTHHPVTLHLREKGLNDSWLLRVTEAKRGPRKRILGNAV